MDDDSKVELTGDEGTAAAVDEAAAGPAPVLAVEPAPHPVDVAAADLPAKQQNALLAVKDWVEERLANLPRAEMEQAFKDWVRTELRLAMEGHSEETRSAQNP